MTVFAIADPADDLTALTEAFVSGGCRGPVPVHVSQRRDLMTAVGTAEDLYGHAQAPQAVDIGVLLDPDLPDALVTLLTPLATRWVSHPELLEGLGTSGAGDILIAGTYASLRSDLMQPVIIGADANRRDLSVLSGRDLPSLWWHVAKQFAVPRPDIYEAGLFTATDRPQWSHELIEVFDERRLESENIQEAVLGRLWQSVKFQGHGKDDSINLADFTICGLNLGAERVEENLGPRCAYGLGCYKPEDKLVPLNQVRAVELVLSACNSGPLPDLALYDPKFQLLLNALDGPGQRVVSAVTVHDSDRPENEAWIDAVARRRDVVRTLNASLHGSHPYPAFLRFGLPGSDDSPGAAKPLVDARTITVAQRLNGYLSGSLLPPPRIDSVRGSPPWSARSTCGSPDRHGKPPAPWPSTRLSSATTCSHSTRPSLGRS